MTFLALQGELKCCLRPLEVLGRVACGPDGGHDRRERAKECSETAPTESQNCMFAMRMVCRASGSAPDVIQWKATTCQTNNRSPRILPTQILDHFGHFHFNKEPHLNGV